MGFDRCSRWSITCTDYTNCHKVYAVKKVAYSISTYTNTSTVRQRTMDCIKNIRENTADKIICTNHLSGDRELIDLCDYYIYDSVNVLTTHTFYTVAWQQTESFKATINLVPTKNDTYHGPAVHQNIYNGICVANMMGFDYVICTNFDTKFSSNEFQKINSIIDELYATNKKGFFLYEKGQEGNTLKTVFFIINPAFYLEHFKNIRSESEYNDLVSLSGSDSNGLENVYYHVLKNSLDSFKIVEEHESVFFNESQSFDSSQAEYFTVLPMSGRINGHVNTSIYCNCVNAEDNRTVRYSVTENGVEILNSGFEIKGRMWHMNHFKANNDKVYKITFDIIGDNNLKRKELVYNGFDEIKQCGELLIF